jgi:hypothetical protein
MEAERLAKEGVIEIQPNQFAAIPFGIVKNLIKKQLEQRHRERWTACTRCRQSKLLIRYPLTSIANEVLAMSKLRLRAAVVLLTVHTSLKEHLLKVGHTEWQGCRICGHDKENSAHIVCDCPDLACKRQDLGLHVSKA